MQIKRRTETCSDLVITLTPDELKQAYKEYQHKMLITKAKSHCDTYDSDFQFDIGDYEYIAKTFEDQCDTVVDDCILWAEIIYDYLHSIKNERS